MNNSNVEMLNPLKQEIINQLEQQDTLVKVKGMQDTLQDDLVLLEGKVSEIDDCNPIKTKKILWIPSIDKKASFEGLSEQDKEIVVCFKDALSRVNVRIHDIVSLIEQVVLFENDLYKIFDEYQTDSNELKQVLHDIFQEKGLTEEEIYKLLDSSFLRARTLRDRINTVRSEQQKENAQINSHLTTLEERLNNKADSSALCHYVKTDDTRLSDARPASDVHTWAKAKEKPEYNASEIKDLDIPTKTSQLNNDCGFLTEHQDISGKANISYVEEQLQHTKNDISREVGVLQQSLQIAQDDLQREQQEYTKLKKAFIATSICTGTISLGALVALLILIL